ncbi:hypothetical protein Tco_0085520 [Tanacetum coccineum]
MDLTAATKNLFMELNELIELRDGAYENMRIYKERTKRWHDSRLHGDKNFKVGDKVTYFTQHRSLIISRNMVRSHADTLGLCNLLAVVSAFLSTPSAGLPWTVAKGQDTFTPISSIIRFRTCSLCGIICMAISLSKVPDPHSLELWLKFEIEWRVFVLKNYLSLDMAITRVPDIRYPSWSASPTRPIYLCIVFIAVVTSDIPPLVSELWLNVEDCCCDHRAIISIHMSDHLQPRNLW